MAACCLLEGIGESLGLSPRSSPQRGVSYRSDSTREALHQPGAFRPHQRQSALHYLLDHFGLNSCVEVSLDQGRDFPSPARAALHGHLLHRVSRLLLLTYDPSMHPEALCPGHFVHNRGIVPAAVAIT